MNVALTREDWMAARIGAQDAARFGCRQPAVPRETLGRFARVLVWLMGDDNAPRPLANPRLEAVRRFACATRAGNKPGVALVSELHAMGVQPAHLAALNGLLL
jgi:hypothetical protein